MKRLLVWAAAACLLALAASINPPSAAAADIKYSAGAPFEVVVGERDLTAAGATPSFSNSAATAGVGMGTITITGPEATSTGSASISSNVDGLIGTSATVLSPFSDPFSVTGSSSGAGFYDSSMRTFSGLYAPPTPPGTWTLEVLPTGAEVAGTPTLITVDASIAGSLGFTGASTAGAAWSVATDHGGVMGGATSASGAFSDSGLLSFIIPLGSTFDLTFLYEIDVAGSGVASSSAEVTEALITITAEVGASAIPEPSSLALFGFGAVGLIATRRRRRKRAA